MVIMKRWVKWLVAIVLGLLVLLASVAAALQYWVRSEDFRDRVSQQITQAVGVPVRLGRISVDLWPVPAVALDQVQFDSRPPLTLERVEARPIWAGLLQRRLDVATLVVRNAVVPEQGVAALAAALRKTKRAGTAPPEAQANATAAMVFLPRHVVLDHFTWVPAKGNSLTVNAQAQLDPDGMPASAKLDLVKGRFAGAKVALDREADHWMLRAVIGGGTVAGKVQWQPIAKGGSLLQAQLDTAGVEIAALTAPNRTLTGRLEAHTTLRAEFKELGALADALQTQTRFTVHNAVVHGLDLVQAVKSVGLSRGGETRLDTLAGNLSTQGRSAQLTNLVASSGVLSANGNVALAANKALSGRITVDLASAAAGGALGVPLAVGGTLDEPTVNLTRGAVVGAAVGTLLAPGVGTGAGAKIGDKIGEGLRSLFGK
jgi:uncharacterized protein involved in outer membrane biogenesis